MRQDRIARRSAAPDRLLPGALDLDFWTWETSITHKGWLPQKRGRGPQDRSLPVEVAGLAAAL